jgi:acyl-CoA synthetase (AMP-forming)/AMP-acid ligase II
VTPEQNFLRRFRESPDRVCVVPLAGAPLSYGALWANSQELAARWRREGLRAGNVVALSFPNHVGYFVSYLACAIGGFLACPIPDSHHPDVKRKLVAAAAPSLVVTEPPAIDPARSAIPDADALAGPNRPLLLPFSSGSTGDPKPIALGLRGVLGAAESFGRLTELGEDTVLYHVLPMSYMAGILNAFFAPLARGARIVEGPLFSAAAMTDFWERPLALDANTLSLTPTIAEALVRITRPGPTLDRARARLRQAQSTSAPVPAGLATRFLARFGVPLRNCYGMTEIGGPLTFQSAGDATLENPLSVPVPELEISLRRSELWLRSPFLMLGYRRGDGALELPVDEHGFFDTGDLAEFRDGKLEIIGRKKDIIIRGGVNVAPGRVESVLAAAPGVAEVSVVGVGHSFWGEAIVAWVVAKPGAERDVQAFAREHLGAHERPDHVFAVPELPRSFIGKIQKNELREWARERLAPKPSAREPAPHA